MQRAFVLTFDQFHFAPYTQIGERRQSQLTVTDHLSTRLFIHIHTFPQNMVKLPNSEACHSAWLERHLCESFGHAILTRITGSVTTQRLGKWMGCVGQMQLNINMYMWRGGDPD